MSAIAQHLGTLVSEYGLPALFGTVTLESLGLPLPGESAIMVAAATAAAGKLNILAVALAAVAAAVLGDNIGYFIGRRYGRGFLLRAGGRFGITEAKLARAERVAQQRGWPMVVFARFFVVLRQLNGLVAGSTGMHWLTFFLANVAGAALWVGFWTTMVYRLGQSTTILPLIWHHLALVAGIVVPLVILALVISALRRKRP